VDTPLHLYNRPANKFVAGFIGSPAMNFADATVQRAGSETWLQFEGDLRLRLPQDKAAALDDYVGKSVTFGIRPEDIFDRSITSLPGDAGNTAKGRVEVTEMMGDRAYLELSFGPISWIANVESETQAQDEKPLDVVFDLDKSHAFDPKTDQAVY
jgi:multiple sugar transport system ATP-binding protein